MKAQAVQLVAVVNAVLADPEPYVARWREGFRGFVARSPEDARIWALSGMLRADRRIEKLDRAVRRVDVADVDAWRNCSPDAIRTTPFSAVGPLLEALAMHPNGHVRAAAVDGLATQLELHLPALALRCQDPAPAVRERASAAVVASVPYTDVRRLIELDWLLLGDRMRRLAPGVVDVTEHALLAEPSRTIPWVEWSSQHAAQLLADAPTVRPIELLARWSARGPAGRHLFERGLDRATTADVRWFFQEHERWLPADQLVWLFAARRWPGVDEQALTPATLNRLRRSPVGRLRTGAAGSDLPLGRRRAEDVVVDALLHGLAAPRRMAQRLLAQTGMDVAAYYRQLIEVTPTAVIGLGEVGSRDDVALVSMFLSSDRADFRHVAVNALKLDPDGHIEELVSALEDPDVRVARAARVRLRRRVELVGIDRLIEVGGADRGPHSRAVAIDLLLMLPSDRVLIELLGSRTRLLDHRDFVLDALQRWQRRALRLHIDPAHQPTPALLDRFRTDYADDERVLELLDLDQPDPPTAPKFPGLFALGARHLGAVREEEPDGASGRDSAP